MRGIKRYASGIYRSFRDLLGVTVFGFFGTTGLGAGLAGEVGGFVGGFAGATPPGLAGLGGGPPEPGFFGG